MIDDIASTIRDGDHDDHLGKLFDALFARAAEIDLGFAWTIRIDGDEWNRETVTLGELAFAERLTRVPYTKIDPIGSMDHLVALIVSHLHKVKGKKIDLAIKQADQYSAADLKDIIDVYEVPKPPKENTAEPPTS
jgi:hypothetical protein